jgi:hypothetical protein
MSFVGVGLRLRPSIAHVWSAIMDREVIRRRSVTGQKLVIFNFILLGRPAETEVSAADIRQLFGETGYGGCTDTRRLLCRYLMMR